MGDRPHSQHRVTWSSSECLSVLVLCIPILVNETIFLKLLFCELKYFFVRILIYDVSKFKASLFMFIMCTKFKKNNRNCRKMFLKSLKLCNYLSMENLLLKWNKRMLIFGTMWLLLEMFSIDVILRKEPNIWKIK